MKNKKILITGSNGYLGSHLAHQLLEGGYDVLLTDRGSKSILDKGNYIQEDLAHPKKLSSLLQGVDLIFFFTGRTGPANESFNNPEEFIVGNEITLTNLLKEVRLLSNKPRIIFPSTRLLYKGSGNTSINEEMELEAKTVYAVNKIACENYLDLYHRCFGVNYTIFRISLPYGSFLTQDKISHGVMSFLINRAKEGKDLKIYGSGTQKGTLIHIKDLINILIKGALDDRTANNTYNVGGKNDLMMKDVIYAITKKYGVNAHEVEWPEVSLFAEHGDLIFDSSKLSSIIDYECEYDFFEWLKKI